jgi:hypothetical protein
MRFARRVYRRDLRSNFDEEIREGQEGKEEELYSSVEEDEVEAWENYEFDGMMQFDIDLANQLVDFRASLSIVPPPPGGLTPAMIQAREARTNALWEGYRRLFFGEVDPEPSHEQVMDRLRLEIAELEQRARRARSVRREGDPPFSLGAHRDEDDSNPPPPPASAPAAGLMASHSGHHEANSGSMAQTPNNNPSRGGRLEDSIGLNECSPQSDDLSQSLTNEPRPSLPGGMVGKLVMISKKVLRLVLAAKESLCKFGVFVPKNDREADSSPEASRWKAGRDLEWHRLGLTGTFDGDWTWDKVCSAFPNYRRSDIGFLFYVYDFKFSGEHRVRLVFDGSRQSASTFSETYAPTVRAESVRLFHIVCVEEGYHIGQYDVPQAFLKADIDHDIFAFPPRGQAEFPGQILKLRRALYGGKQSAYLWFQMMNEFLIGLGFKASPLDACFY